MPATKPTREQRAVELVRAVREWALSAYGWEGFWNDMNWRPESSFDNNGKKLRDFIKECEEIFPELKR